MCERDKLDQEEDRCASTFRADRRQNPWPAGVPARADLATDDPEAAATFYGAVLGWTVVGRRPDGSLLLGVDGAVAAAMVGGDASVLDVAGRTLDAVLAQS